MGIIQEILKMEKVTYQLRVQKINLEQMDSMFCPHKSRIQVTPIREKRIKNEGKCSVRPPASCFNVRKTDLLRLPSHMDVYTFYIPYFPPLIYLFIYIYTYIYCVYY